MMSTSRAPGTSPHDTDVVARRIAACLLDNVLVLLASSAAFTPLLFLRPNVPMILSLLLFFLFVNLIVYLGYVVFFEGHWGRTPGKALLGLVVVRAEDGGKPGLGRAALRALMFLSVDGLAGILVMLASPRRERLGDMVAGTLVVRKAPRHKN